MQAPWVEFVGNYGAVVLQLDCFCCGGFYYKAQSGSLTLHATVTPLREDVTLPAILSLEELVRKPCSVYIHAERDGVVFYEGEISLNLGQPLMLVVNNG